MQYTPKPNKRKVLVWLFAATAMLLLLVSLSGAMSVHLLGVEEIFLLGSACVLLWLSLMFVMRRPEPVKVKAKTGLKRSPRG